MTSTEARAALTALNTEYAALKKEHALVVAREREINARVWHLGTVEINKAKEALEHAIRAEADAPLFTVVTASPDRYVVSRVTPKRIYVRRAGETYEHTLDRDGRSETKYGGIEVLNREELVKYADEVGPRRAK